MVIPWLLNRNGQAITLKAEWKGKVGADPKALKPFVEQAKKLGEPLTFAMTFPPGTHAMWVRYYLAAGGIDPDKDISHITVPPPAPTAAGRTPAPAGAISPGSILPGYQSCIVAIDNVAGTSAPPTFLGFTAAPISAANRKCTHRHRARDTRPPPRCFTASPAAAVCAPARSIPRCARARLCPQRARHRGRPRGARRPSVGGGPRL